MGHQEGSCARLLAQERLAPWRVTGGGYRVQAPSKQPFSSLGSQKLRKNLPKRTQRHRAASGIAIDQVARAIGALPLPRDRAWPGRRAELVVTRSSCPQQRVSSHPSGSCSPRPLRRSLLRELAAADDRTVRDEVARERPTLLRGMLAPVPGSPSWWHMSAVEKPARRSAPRWLRLVVVTVQCRWQQRLELDGRQHLVHGPVPPRPWRRRRRSGPG